MTNPTPPTEPWETNPCRNCRGQGVSGLLKCDRCNATGVEPESIIISRLREFIESLERGEPIDAIQVTREQTPDGPLHTHKKVKVKRDR